MSETAYLWLQAAVLVTIPLVLGIGLGKIYQMSALSKARWMKLLAIFSIIGIAVIIGGMWKRTHDRTLVQTPWDLSGYHLFYPENSLVFEKGTAIYWFFSILLIILLLGALISALVKQIKIKKLNERLIDSLQIDNQLEEMMYHVQYQMKLSELAVIARSTEVSAPCLVKLTDTYVLIPEKMQDEKIEWCIAHELIHLQHDDLMMLGIIHMLEIIFWFHPLIPSFKKVYMEIQEMACDERITSKMATSEKLEYLKLLERTLQFAESTEKAHPEICLARKTQIGRRAEKVMKFKLSVKKQVLFTLTMIFAFCMMTLSASGLALFANREMGLKISPATSEYLWSDVEMIEIETLSFTDDYLVKNQKWKGFSQSHQGVYLSSDTKNYTHFLGTPEEREEKILMIAQLNENDIFQLTLNPAKDYFDLIVCSKQNGCRIAYFEHDDIMLALTGFEEGEYCFILKDKKSSGYYLSYTVTLAIR